ncbi:hypothetical protein M2G99_10040 [Vibrio vulnificus]|uniref:hypothetical protein n=1 Tax=Vibrio vulnificus TaxID=672 RepID=UPI0012AE6D37|nr:hypothetical protein [Vibrio vulnificus]ELI0348345.1 hypothetical protein [Vibrio vulnificus]MCU8223419.1 hypothetical protein [Vibrio vulnificus]
MDSRVHGNDDWWFGGGVLSFYRIVALLVFSVIICSSNFFLITSVCQPLSVSQFVILGRRGSIDSECVARCYRYVTGIVVGFALCCCLLWQVRFQT